MKKILCVLFGIACILSCAACGEAPEDERVSRVVKWSKASRPPVEESEEDWTEVSYEFQEIKGVEELPDFMKTNPELYARLLEKMLKLYYIGVVNGTINTDTYTPRQFHDELPDKDSSAEERRNLADYCTVAGALEYFGYDNRQYTRFYDMFNGRLKYFAYDHEAHIYFSENVHSAEALTMNSTTQTLYFIFKYANLDRLTQETQKYAAEEITAAVQQYYQGILKGSITSSFRGKYTHDVLPEKNASQNERQRLAGEATLSGALDYAGFYSVYRPYASRIGYNRKKKTFTVLDGQDLEAEVLSSADIRLSELF